MTWAALILWPIVSAVFFKTLRLPVALLATIIGGFLLLPTKTTLNLPLLPSLDKNSIPALTALAFVFVMTRPPRTDTRIQLEPSWPTLPRFLPRNPVALVLLLVIFIGLIGTYLTNRDAVVYGFRFLPALRLYDGMSAILEMTILLLPFFLARKVLATREGQLLLLKALVIAASAYAFLALYEVRMSPQMNRMVYGFFPHSFAQHFRGDGWRPIVFLEHGLQLGIFFTVSIICAASLVRITSDKERLIWLLLMFWLLGTLFLSKVLGAQMICVMMLAAVFFLPRRLQSLFVVFLIICFLMYPVLRTTNFLLFDLILSNVAGDRAWSFQYRLDNEQLLLEKANERPLFGWGGWGRSRVYSEEGWDIATTDGGWVIRLGLGGWVGYIGYFGLMTWGAISLLWQRRRSADQVSVALALALTAMIVDLIPNALQTPMLWLLAGSLIGRPEAIDIEIEETEKLPNSKRTVRYARFEPGSVPRSNNALPKSPRYHRNLGETDT